MRGSTALRALPRADRRAVVAARRHRAAAPRPSDHSFGEEVRHLQELIVLRLLAREPHAVVERQPGVHLPVVLQVELGVVVDHAAFDQLRLLQVLREHADRRVGEAEAGIERVVRVVAEVDVALEAEVRHAAGAGVLRLEAVVVVEAGLARVRAPDLRQADRDVLRAVDVQEPGKQLIRRPGQVARRRPVPTMRLPQPNAGGRLILLPSNQTGLEFVQHAVARSSAGRRRPHSGRAAGSPAGSSAGSPTR